MNETYEQYNNQYNNHYMYKFDAHMLQDLIDYYDVDMSLYNPANKEGLSKREYINLISEIKIKYKDVPRIPDYSEYSEYKTEYKTEYLSDYKGYYKYD